MGKRLGAADVDKWALYVIGQYCDQSVPDGFGGTEPRITCNAYRKKKPSWITGRTLTATRAAR
ncbi:hypothetical protein KZD00_004019 [Escherichia coli]|nr:hypothetical protein [Escherichia coli]